MDKKSKWFLAANILLAVVLIGLIASVLTGLIRIPWIRIDEVASTDNYASPVAAPKEGLTIRTECPACSRNWMKKQASGSHTPGCWTSIFRRSAINCLRTVRRITPSPSSAPPN